MAARYALLLVWPRKLSHDYSCAQIPASSGAGPLEIAGILLIVGLLAGIALAARRARVLAIALAICPVAFFPVSNVPFAIGTIAALALGDPQLARSLKRRASETGVTVSEDLQRAIQGIP